MKQLYSAILLSTFCGISSADSLIEFNAGDQIYASEINQNFNALQAQIDELKNQLAQFENTKNDSFNIEVVGGVTLEAGYDYYVTDAAYEFNNTAAYCDSFADGSQSSSATIKANSVDIIKISPNSATRVGYDSADKCAFTGRKLSFITPIKISGGTALSTNIADSTRVQPSIRLLGYRLPVTP